MAWKWGSQRSWPEAFFSLVSALGANKKIKEAVRVVRMKESLWDQGSLGFENRQKFYLGLFYFEREPILGGQETQLSVSVLLILFLMWTTCLGFDPSTMYKWTLALFSNCSFGRKSFAFYFSVFFSHYCALEDPPRADTWFNSTCCHPSPGHTPEDMPFFYLAAYSPPLGTKKELENFPPRDSDLPQLWLYVQLGWQWWFLCNSKNIRFVKKDTT